MKIRSVALSLLIALSAPCALNAQTFGSDTGDDFRRLTKEEGAKVLADFRRSRVSGERRMRFVITHSERNADEDTRYVGEMCVAPTPEGLVTRVDLRAEGRPESERRSFLIVNGARTAVYGVTAGGKVGRVDGEALKPMLPGLVFTPYDLQMPFIHWPEFKYRRTERFRTRPTDYFDMTPDAEFRKAHPGISGVNLGFDRAYKALMRAETRGGDGRAVRDLRAESFGKVRGEWTIRSLRLRDERTRAADTLEVTGVAAGDLPSSVFTPEGLLSPLPPAPDTAFEKID